MNPVYFGTFNTCLPKKSKLLFVEKSFKLHLTKTMWSNLKHTDCFCSDRQHLKWTVSSTGKKKQHKTVPYQCCWFIPRIWQQCHSINLTLTGSDKACRQKKCEHPGNRRTGAALIVSLEGTLILSIRLPAHFMPRSDCH